MSLTAEQRARYSRHLMVAELGAEGQERLLATRFSLSPGADPFAAEVARRYLEASGATMVAPGERGVEPSLPSRAAVASRAGRKELEIVEAGLAGAVAALEVVRSAVGWELAQ